MPTSANRKVSSKPPHWPVSTNGSAAALRSPPSKSSVSTKDAPHASASQRPFQTQPRADCSSPSR